MKVMHTLCTHIIFPSHDQHWFCRKAFVPDHYTAEVSKYREVRTYIVALSLNQVSALLLCIADLCNGSKSIRDARGSGSGLENTSHVPSDFVVGRSSSKDCRGQCCNSHLSATIGRVNITKRPRAVPKSGCGRHRSTSVGITLTPTTQESHQNRVSTGTTIHMSIFATHVCGLKT